MNEGRLWEFVRNIVASGSEDKKYHALHELKAILTRSGAQRSQIEYVDFAIKNLPEVSGFANKGVLSKEDCETIKKRGEERRKREEAARLQSRC